MAAQQALLRAYLIVGGDKLKQEAAIKRLKGHLEEGLADFNLDEIDATSDPTPDSLRATLETLPFGAGFRLVIIYAADKLSKPASEALVSYLDDPNPGCVLCLVAEKLSRGTRLYKAVAQQGAQAIVDCAPRKRWELPAYVQKMAQSHGISISNSAAELLVSLVGESSVMLDNSLATLRERYGQAANIDRDEVAAAIARTAEVRPWDFLDALSARDVTGALQLYYAMASPSLIALVSMLTGRLRELICAKALAERGEASQLAAELGRADWQVKHHGRWAQNFSMAELEELLCAGLACDRALKGSEDSETAFIRYVLAFAPAPTPSAA